MRKYGLNDMVKADCRDCAGCSACCQGMGNSILLDPLDIYCLTKNLHKSFAQLMEDVVALHVEDGLVLPGIQMNTEDKCPFLNAEGRCSIHAFRPGLCRTFPLGRNYEEGELTYFLLEGACPKTDKVKVKVEKWIATPSLEVNQKFLVTWHYLLKNLRGRIARTDKAEQETEQKQIAMLLLNLFYAEPYDVQKDFYEQFFERYCQMSEKFPV